ncbi:hypothetical protein [Cellulomonas fengjieae]|uniref:hypothetical protein n=1 Tax=Cellulomonas fengjieae TaxID=2819978 RepID=UPI001AAFD1B5|nr:hypothetical protein [Cellulomonas fengjieae]MBO3102465.1 hypothetical protein [Cellulomonas fengjieae]
MQIGHGLPLVLGALDDVVAAHRAVTAAGHVAWRSPAADRFRTALEEADAEVRAAQVAVERAVQPVAAADADAETVLVGR